ncbi:hypothetical protein FOL47_005252 [Perkinsus chesapeaki]|uniref:Pheromone-processing carboxypeptidase KEX1 n=1 Tax=Perkinsus chesapeaki TaxID=330153 RepID=A0A7J6LY25_PERCH|nr:hypothetical protein FOL47_005252 [Perkinsus chesapeaki]
MRAFLLLLPFLSLFPSASASLADDHRVVSLPGYGQVDGVYAGHVIANNSADGHLWYMLFEQEDANVDTPLLIWLNGGPGASSSLGNLLENGPYRLNPNMSLTRNPSTWANLGHSVYFDQPVGTGFSYASTEGYVANFKQIAEQFSTALDNFFDIHPKLRSADTYITGESFAGVYIPVITSYLLERNKRLAEDKQVHLKGMIIGNPGNLHWTQYRAPIEYYYVQGLIGKDAKGEAEEMWRRVEALMGEGRELEAFRTAEKMQEFMQATAGHPFLYDTRQWGDTFNNIYSTAMKEYFSRQDVAAALHTRGVEWQNGDGTATPNPVAIKLEGHLMTPVLKEVQSILSAKLPTLIYAGVFDGSSCGHLSVVESLHMLNYEPFETASRELWEGSDHPFGFVQSGGDLTFVWVSNSGHMVPTDQPEAALDMIRRFLNGRSLSGKDKMLVADAEKVIM